MKGPFALPAWQRLLRHVGRRIGSDRSSLVAAGWAFYGTLALFLALSMVVSLYGLAFDSQSVAVKLGLVEGLLPLDAFGLIARLVTAPIAQPQRTLRLSLLVGLGMTLWSASAATKALLSALNPVHGCDESWGGTVQRDGLGHDLGDHARRGAGGGAAGGSAGGQHGRGGAGRGTADGAHPE